MAIIEYVQNDGYYNDGNSHYWTNEILVDLDKMITTINRTDTYGGQLAGGQFAHKVEETSDDRPTKLISVAQEAEILEALKPFIETANKYPRLNHFRTFSQPQWRFFHGRLGKARQIAFNSDSMGVHCASTIFILPSINRTIKMYVPNNPYKWQEGYSFEMKPINQPEEIELPVIDK